MKRFVVSKDGTEIEDFSSRLNAVKMASKLAVEIGKKKAGVIVFDRATDLIVWENESYKVPGHDVGGWGGQ